MQTWADNYHNAKELISNGYKTLIKAEERKQFNWLKGRDKTFYCSNNYFFVKSTVATMFRCKFGGDSLIFQNAMKAANQLSSYVTFAQKENKVILIRDGLFSAITYRKYDDHRIEWFHGGHWGWIVDKVDDYGVWDQLIILGDTDELNHYINEEYFSKQKYMEMIENEEGFNSYVIDHYDEDCRFNFHTEYYQTKVFRTFKYYCFLNSLSIPDPNYILMPNINI
ncbi:hypothetical protein [Terasakiella pusilla]|uniref:hypothetical protein n=1 Tax=Terasakiella pusilla TaxID=64973 RepID=UPI003AA96CF0